MPLFDYRCESCGEVRELLVRASDADPGRCACGGALTQQPAMPADLRRMDSFYHKDSFTDSDIASKGLTKYVNRGDGTYEKAAGSGPSIMSRDQLPG